MTVKLPRPVLWLGIASLFTDLASEAVYPILPFFLQSMGASVLFIGLLEGGAESIASITKLFAGYIHDRTRFGHPMVLFGYGLSNLVRPLMSFVSSPLGVLSIRYGDRFGKGVRTAPRDAWLAKHASPQTRGRIYGFHRGMDHLGASLAPLFTAAFLYFKPAHYRELILLTWIPGILAILSIVGAMRSERAILERPPERAKSPLQFKDLFHLPKKFYLLLGVVFLSTLGCSADFFILIKLKDSGLPEIWIPILWTLLSFVKMSSSLWAGRLSDKIGRTKMILSGWLIYSFSYLGFSLIENLWSLLVVFCVYGLYFGFVEAPEKALVTDLVEEKKLGTAFGLYHLITGIALFPASVIFATVWKDYGSSLAFLFSASFTLAACPLFLVLRLHRASSNV